MYKYRFEISTGDPNEKDFQTLSQGLLLHHASHGHVRKSEKICIFLKDNQNNSHAGIIATILWNGMHIDSLWVDEKLRHQGYGSQLVTAAESEAIKRKCKISYTDTFSWQAPGFYEKLGYKVYGILPNFPENNQLIYYFKILKAQNA